GTGADGTIIGRNSLKLRKLGRFRLPEHGLEPRQRLREARRGAGEAEPQMALAAQAEGSAGGDPDLASRQHLFGESEAVLHAVDPGEGIEGALRRRHADARKA